MLIRTLDPATDRAVVEAFFVASADYVRLERGAEPTPDLAEDYFTDAPPGSDPAASHCVGLFGGDQDSAASDSVAPDSATPDSATLIGLAELSFGYPDATSAYIGLMMIVPRARGQGAGQTLLRHLEATARSRGAATLFLAVLDANPRGAAFWQRQGFNLALANRPVTIGTKTQLAHRLYKPL